MNSRVVYLDMPPSVKAYTILDGEGFYTIVLNGKLSYEQNMRSYRHELLHIGRNDFDTDCNVDAIERVAHD